VEFPGPAGRLSAGARAGSVPVRGRLRDREPAVGGPAPGRRHGQPCACGGP